MNILQTVVSVYITVRLCEEGFESSGAYREHRGGEQTPCKKLQEDDHHSMVNTGLTDSLRLERERNTDKDTEDIS